VSAWRVSSPYKPARGGGVDWTQEASTAPLVSCVGQSALSSRARLGLVSLWLWTRAARSAADVKVAAVLHPDGEVPRLLLTRVRHVLLQMSQPRRWLPGIDALPPWWLQMSENDGCTAKCKNMDLCLSMFAGYFLPVVQCCVRCHRVRDSGSTSLPIMFISVLTSELIIVQLTLHQAVTSQPVCTTWPLIASRTGRSIMKQYDMISNMPSK